MGLITKEVIMKWRGNNKNTFISKGYLYTKHNDEFLVKVEDLPDGSNAKVNIECDVCSKELKNINWRDYIKYVKEDGKYYCKKCALKLYGTENYRKSRLKNGKSFEQWCIENNRQDILERWDYELNNCKPSEISYSSNSQRYFKCLEGIHKSELKNIHSFTSGQEGSMDCKACNSFAQWGIDNLGSDFLDKYWDYEKNNELGINPWKISKSSSKKYIFIKCQNKLYHIYKISCADFTKGIRCSFCRSLTIHPLDSLGKLLEDKGLLHLWSGNNKKSSYEYAPYSSKKVYWKCPDGKHEDYYRKISESNKLNFRCPECNYSKGEEAISNCFINKEFIKILQREFDQLIYKYNKNFYISQKTFNGLIGLKGGLLSYDFYIPKLNLLIEYQGEQHERYIPGFHKSKKDFLKQLEHDKRKREYAKNHNINLLEIWYYDFENIKSILQKELNLLEVMPTNCVEEYFLKEG